MGRWRRFYLPFGLAALVMVLGLGALAWLTGQRVSRIEGFHTPESVALGSDGRVYVSNLGQPGRDGDGTVQVLEAEAPRAFATGLNDPKGRAFIGPALFAADVDRIWRLDPEGGVELWLGPEGFPQRPRFLNDLAADPQGNLYVSDTQGGQVWRITSQRRVEAVLEGLPAPNGLWVEPDGALLVVDFAQGRLVRRAPDGTLHTVAEGLGGGDGIARDRDGTLYVSDFKGGRVLRIAPGANPSAFLRGLRGPADLALDVAGRVLLIPEFNADRLTVVTLDR